MATRREAVRLVLEDDFTTGMLKAAAAAGVLNRELDSLSHRSVRTSRSLSDVDRSVTSTGRNLDRSGNQIDKYSGRLRVLAEVGAMIAPAFVPIGAAAVPVLAGLANQLGIAVAAGGTAILAFHGVGDALKALNDYRLLPTDAHLQALRVSMSALSPAGREFARTLDDMRPALADLQASAQAGLFPGLTDALDAISTRAPEVQQIVATIASTMGDLAAEGADALAGPEWDDFFESLRREAKPALEDMGHALGNVVQGLAELWQAFLPLSNDFGAGLVRMSADFERWADGLAQTQGFHDFVDYVRQSGPQVAEFLGAVSDAFVQIVEAAAPLGGPVLHVLTDLSQVLAAIADSDLGTPIFTALAALSAYNRAMALAGSLSKAAFGRQMASAAKLAALPLRGLAADVATVGTTWLTAGAQSEREMARVGAAAGRLKMALAGAFTFAATIEGINLLDQALDSLFDRRLDGSNLDRSLQALAKGRLAGTLKDTFGGDLKEMAAEIDDVASSSGGLARELTKIPGLGGIVPAQRQHGGLRGILDTFVPTDFGHSMKDSIDNINDLDQALAQMVESGNAEQAAAAFGAIEKAVAAQGVDAATVQKAFRQYGLALDNAKASAGGASATTYSYMQATRNAGTAAGHTAAEIKGLVDAMHKQRQAALGAFDAETQWRQALKDAEAQGRRSNAGIKGSSDAALANRAALSQLAGAWNNQSAAVKNNTARFHEARQAFIDTAHAMGVPIPVARALAKQLLDIPKQAVIRAQIVGGDAAVSALQRINREIRGIPKAWRTTYYVNQVNTVSRRAAGGRDGDPTTPYADGGYTGDYPRREPVGVVHGQEFVFDAVSTKRAGVENLYAMQRRLRGYADGGHVDGKPKPNFFTPAEFRSAAGDFNLTEDLSLRELAHAFDRFARIVDRDGGHVAKGFRDLERQARRNLRVYDREAEERDGLVRKLQAARQVRSEARSAAAGSFDNDIFGGGLSDLRAQLDADTNDATAMRAAIRRAKRHGLSGDFGAELAGSGNLALAQEVAGLSRAQITRLEHQFASRAHAQSLLGETGASFYTRHVDTLERQVRAQNRELKRLHKTLEHLEDRVEAGARKGVRDRDRGAGHRRRTR